MRWRRLGVVVGLGLVGLIGVRPPSCEAVNSRLLNGTTDLINFGRAAAVDDLGPLTGCAWIKPAGLGGGGFGRILAKENTGANGAWNFFVNTNNSLKFSKDFATTDLDRTSGNNAISLSGTWQHVCVTWDGTATTSGVVLYAGGTALSSTGTTGVGTEVSDAALNVIVGNRQNAGRAFNGNLAYVQIFSRVLSASEIQQIMLQPESVTSGLVFYATLQGVSPETDDSTTALSGTLTGTTVDTGDGPTLQEPATCLSGWTQPRTWLRLAQGRLR